MSSVFGTNIQISVFGESHGPLIGITIHGLSAGVEVDEEYIKHCLSLRRPQNSYETSRKEEDEYQIVSGVFNGYTTGSPLTIVVPNNNTRSADYNKNKDKPRPSHADYVTHIKYNGYEDYRGGGHFSGRITAAIVAGGAIVLKALENIGISIGSHILSIGNVSDVKYSDFANEIKKTNELAFPVISNVKENMEAFIQKVAENGDSVGGIIEAAVTGLPVGVGSPMFDSLESVISHAIFSIGAVKGIEFGKGFDFAKGYGSELNDAFEMENGKVITKTNNNGGINGGISNSMPVTFNVAVKPTPSILKSQDTVNLSTLENDKLLIQGRHDPAIIRRINIVIRAMTAFAISDLLVNRYGEEVLKKGF